MSDDRFLPPTVDGEAIPGDHSNSSFSEESKSLLADIAKNMVRGEPKTTPRRPTPFSALWQFAADLRGDAGSILKDDARRRLRALLSTIALRDRYGIDLNLRISPRFGEEEEAGAPFVSMLRAHRNSAPDGSFLDASLLSFAIGDKVVAGFSPLTVAYPAARKPTLEASVSPLWFAGSLHDWLDPTREGPQIEGSEKRVPNEIVAAVRPMMKKWATWARLWLTNRPHGELPKIEPKQLLLNELEHWLAELQAEDDGGIETCSAPLPVTGEPAQEISQFLDCELFKTVLSGRPNTSLKYHRGRALLTRELLGDPAVVIHGNVRGRKDLENRWNHAPAHGEHLGNALDLPASEAGSLPISYVFVDKLFQDEIHQISELREDDAPVTSGWTALNTEAGVYLLPFKEEILKFLTIDEIRAGFSCQELAGEFVQARIDIAEESFTQNYNALSQIKPFDRSLDFRLFPAYDLSSVNDPAKMLPKEDDRAYHTRIRVAPDHAGLQIIPLIGERGGHDRLAGDGEFDVLDEPHESGFTKRHRIRPGVGKLRGFVFKDRGMLLVDLPTAASNAQESPRIISIDFGTSNSCIGSQNSEILGDPHRPEPNVTTLLHGLTPVSYDGNLGEGHAALFDFFPYYPSKTVESPQTDESLYSADFFPTQIAARQDYFANAEPSHESGFDPKNGLICFKSVSEMLQINTQFVETIKEFSSGNGDPAIIHLRDRIKWGSDNDEEERLLLALRRLFHQHLRLHLVHHAARRGEYVSEVRASYPRAFTNAARSTYEQELRHIWTEGDEPRVTIQTESAAAASQIGAKAMQDHFLVDIGGGTSDVCLFADGKLHVESSFRLASDKIDRLILSPQSRELRECIVGEVRGIPGIDNRLVDEIGQRFINATASPDKFEAGAITQRGLLYAVLGLANHQPTSFDTACERIAEKHLGKPAIQTLFHTVLFLFGGLTYFAGRMYRNHLGANEPVNRLPCLTFVGNGSRHAGWLGPLKEQVLTKTLGSIFRLSAGLSEDTPVSVDFLEKPKAAVARGLASGKSSDTPIGQDTRVYDAVDAEWAEDGSLEDFYRSLDTNRASTWSFEKSSLKKIAQAIEQSIDGGRLGNRQILASHSDGWTTALCDQTGVGNRICMRLMNERRIFGKELDLNQTGGLGLEPIEIAELAGFLDFLNEGKA